MNNHGPSMDEEELEKGVDKLYADNVYRRMLLVFL